MSEATQEADPVSSIPPADAQAANPVSCVRPRDAQKAVVPPVDEQKADFALDVIPADEQVGRETAVIDVPLRDGQQATEAVAAHVQLGDEQATNPPSDVRPGNAQAARETVVIDVQPRDEQATNPASCVRPADVRAAGEVAIIDVSPDDDQARDRAICDYIFKVRGRVAEVIKPLRKEFIDTAVPATYLGQMFGIAAYKPLFVSVVFNVFCGSKPNLGEIRNIMAGCIQFELRCFTEDKFLEILKDYE